MKATLMVLYSCAIILSTFCVVSPAQAGYDKADWEMSLLKIKNLYPNGKIIKSQNGEFTYGVVRPVAGLATAYILFNFNNKSKLTQVFVLFPKQGADVNLNDGHYDETTSEDGKAIFKTVFGSLVLKYGSPDSLSDDEKKVWAVKDDVIALTTLKGINGGHSTVGLQYQKIKSLDELSNGL